MGRCAMCHAPEPVWTGIGIAPKAILLDEAQHIHLQKDALRMHSVLTRAMPLDNITGLTLEERLALAAWTGKR
jgi:uncharacterized membrane protein